MDANLDRLSEGLRVLEDAARFILDDTRTTETLKRMRHELTSTEPDLKRRLLAARDTAEDIGRQSPVTGIERTRLADLVTANARRAQESLRVLEECAKLPQAPSEIARRDFEAARFALYEIERELTLRLSRQDKVERLEGLYVIIDSPSLSGVSEVEAVRRVIRGGARAIQFRDKQRPVREFLAIAGELRDICHQAGILFIINDNVEAALATESDGVHLGPDDLPVSLAREMLPPDMLVGCSARTVERALKAQAEGADYIGVGAMYPSPTRKDAEIIGPERLREIKRAASLPVIAIGGITAENIGEVLDHGADCVAVISAVLKADDMETATRRLAEAISKRGES